MKLRREVSDILNHAVPEKGYVNLFKNLERDGRLTQKQTNELIALILTRLEELENEK